MAVLLGCKEEGSPTHVTVTYHKDKAINVSFDLVAAEAIKVYIANETTTPVLGSLNSKGTKHWFTPIIPFTPDESYSIYNGTQRIATFRIRRRSNTDAPELTAIYPSRDTLPENLLKIYLLFSQPMQEVGRALDYIQVTDRTEQEEVQVFLDLETELWNKEHTRLTLWLDPGRIKTDLIPNREQGLPLIKGHAYTITISDRWKAANGSALKQTYEKTVYVAERDSQRPLMSRWNLGLPKASTSDPLDIQFGEAMDAVLVMETIAILDTKGNALEGSYTLREAESILRFQPLKNWSQQTYVLQVDPILEDLSGNNLDHLFDTDLNEKKDLGDSLSQRHRNFIIGL
ncbi:MAG: Ig-like domain-containing protein [Saonia sp.]